MVQGPETAARTRRAAGLDVGDVIGRSFRIWLRNLVPFTVIMAIVMVPDLVWCTVLVGRIGSGWFAPEELNWYLGGSVALSLVLQPVAAGAIVFGVFRQLRGEPAGMGRCLAAGFGKLLPVMGVAVVSALIVLGGLVLLIVPGIIFSLALFVAVPAAVVQKMGVMQSIRYSFDLTKGYRGKIFGVLFVINLIERAITFVMEKALLSLDASPATLVANLRIYLVAMAAVGLVFGAISAVASGLVYYNLRVEKEGVDQDALASVFD